MSWLGKACGGALGFMMGGPLGAMLGAAIGHRIDKDGAVFEPLENDQPFQAGHQQRTQMAFFTATFSIMGHIAKVDGTVSKAEIQQAEAIMAQMELSGEMRKAAIELFKEGKNPKFPLDDALDQFRHECHQSLSLIRMFVDIQLQVALADGIFSYAEDQLLLHMCGRLHFSPFDYERLKLILQAQRRFSSNSGSRQNTNRKQTPPHSTHRSTLSDAYAILGIQKNATDAEVKRAYRRLISQNHPDKLVAKGLPEEMMKIATEKTQKIRKAYEQIQQARKL